jgi:hypothetical protein
MATTKQTQMIAGRMVEFQDRFKQLPNEDAQWLIQNTGEAINLIIDALVGRVKKVKQAILSAVVSTLTIPATTKKFVAKDNFVVDTGRNAKVKIAHLSDNFKTWFMGVTEEAFPGSTIYGRQLKKSSVDVPILTELGGQEKAIITLTELYAAMAAQPNGEDGDLMNNGRANIFYIPDNTGTLRVVDVHWNVFGWFVSAYSVGVPSDWRVGYQVFSRNSLIS